jgi:hypothetical protein
MDRRVVVAWLALMVMAPLAPAPAAAEPAAVKTPFTGLRVRIYDSARLPRAQMVKALRDAGGLLATVGVEVQWGDCSTGTAPSCAQPLGASEVALRLVHTPTPPQFQGNLPLGDSLIDEHLHTGVLATIYYERVEWLANAAGMPVAPLLARTIAHEMAHLLIGSHHHGESGLMRAVWSSEDLKRSRSEDWGFTAADAAAIRARRQQN